MTQTPPTRLHVVDALRGFAIVSILLLHNLEHFDYYFFPEQLPAWMKALDKTVWDTTFFLFSGKSYAIFALLFGLTFFIQSDNQARKGKDFRGRFAWRLLLLFLFGTINSAFYEGDILAIYAIIGFCLIPVAHLSDKKVFWIAVVLMLQPYEWINLINGLLSPQTQLGDPLSWSYFGRSGSYITGNSFRETLYGNFTNGKTAVYLWTWEEGRVFQTASLFMLGMLAGRRGWFVRSEGKQTIWWRVLIAAVLCFIPLYVIKTNVPQWIHEVAIHRPLSKIIGTWSNLSFMLIWVSGFVLLYHTTKAERFLKIFSPIGKMSMSNYIIQSALGSFIYCGYGLAMYLYTGATYCLLIGLGMTVLMWFFSHWWMKTHKQGPLETIWHRLTWIRSK